MMDSQESARRLYKAVLDVDFYTRQSVSSNDTEEREENDFSTNSIDSDSSNTTEEEDIDDSNSISEHEIDIALTEMDEIIRGDVFVLSTLVNIQDFSDEFLYHDNQIGHNLLQQECADPEEYIFSIPLHWVSCLTNQEMVKRCLCFYDEGAHQECTSGELPLHLACHHSTIEIVHHLVESHHDSIYHEDNNGYIPLHIASFYNRVEIVSMLAKMHSEETIVRDLDGFQPIHIAARKGHAKVIKAILQVHPSAIFSQVNGSLCIHLAAMSGQVKVVHYLLSLRSELALVMNDDGYIALHLAASHGKLNVVQFLLENHPEGIIIKSTNEGSLPIMVAAENGHEEVVIELLRRSLSLNALELGGMLEQKGRRHDATEPIWQRSNTPWNKILEICGKQRAIEIFDCVATECPTQLVHGAIGKLPVADFELILEAYRPNLTTIDGQNRMALEVAIQQACKNISQWSSYYTKIIDLILCYGRGSFEAQTIENRRHPLHIAAEEGLHWNGIKDLLKGQKIAQLTVEDSKSRLLPFHLAGVGPKSRLDTIYQMLQLSPDVLSYYY